jgi:hypothetical protein
MFPYSSIGFLFFSGEQDDNWICNSFDTFTVFPLWKHIPTGNVSAYQCSLETPINIYNAL